jgi:hypothetical protein
MDVKTILTLIGLAAVVIVVLKFGRQLLTLAIVLAVIVVVAGLAWVLFQIADLDGETLGDVAAVARVFRPAPEPEPKATTPAAVYVCGGAIGTLALAALGAAGFFWLRWRLERAGYSRRPQLPRQTARRSPRGGQWPVMVFDGEVDFGWSDDDLGWEEWGGGGW